MAVDAGNPHRQVNAATLTTATVDEFIATDTVSGFVRRDERERGRHRPAIWAWAEKLKKLGDGK